MILLRKVRIFDAHSHLRQRGPRTYRRLWNSENPIRLLFLSGLAQSHGDDRMATQLLKTAFQNASRYRRIKSEGTDKLELAQDFGATKPVDFRKGMDGLAALVKEQLKADPFSGVIFCFRSKRADRVKLILWDGTGLYLFAKRLEGGKFRWPRIEDGVMRLSAAQLAALIEGLDWMRVRARRVPAPQAMQ
jgi:transposase